MVSNRTGRPYNRTAKQKVAQGIAVLEKEKLCPILLGAVGGIFSYYPAKVKNLDPISAHSEMQKVGKYVGQKCSDMAGFMNPKNNPSKKSPKKTLKKPLKKL
ncbi:hypothetical protein TKK_0001606 [Trichogramma kaykai]